MSTSITGVRFAALAGLIAGAVSLGGCTGRLPGKPMSDEAFADAAAQARILREDAKDFRARHAFKGHPGGLALRSLREEGFDCGISHLNLLRRDADPSGQWV
ncbi:MAG: hypothetical protein EOP37_26495 [Rubrivivax sp.]|nr:MAG: hypothetical protein EOP37_26495 [Rubrivivax sp.]